MGQYRVASWTTNSNLVLDLVNSTDDGYSEFSWLSLEVSDNADNDTGINMLVYFSTRIFANIGLTSFMSQLLAAVMNTFFAIGTYCKSN